VNCNIYFVVFCQFQGFEGIVTGENLESGSGILPLDSLKTGLAMSRNNGSGVLQFLEVLASKNVCRWFVLVKQTTKN
jgi:hypothetical protein